MDGSGWEYLERCSKDYDKSIEKLNKQIERLQEQLKEAQNLIIYTANGHDHLFAQIKCEDYMHKYHLPKWGVK